FIVKALAEMELLDVQEPFQALFTQGMILGPDGHKMSKSRGNVVSPGPIVERYGADPARCYILFIGPPDQDADWSDDGVEGGHRFLGRLWRLGAETAEHGDEEGTGEADDELNRKAHWAIDKVTGDPGRRFAFHTAVSGVVEVVNDCYRMRATTGTGALRAALGTAASLIFPFAP